VLRRRAYKFLFEGEIAEGSGQQQGVQMQPVFINPHPVSPYSGTMEPIPIDKFKDHVERMHSNDDYLFSEEYNSIEPHHAPTSIACHLSCNISKNRYANIVAYDHSRVKLSEDPNKEGSDYINANFIDGYKQRNAFIAAQGPNPDTVADFWRMVWEQGSAIIVMLTNLEEKGRTKCHQYWPEDKSGLFGRIRVHLQESLVLTDYTQRCFSLQMNSSKEERIVVQYHYTVWPDHGVPEYPTSLLHFVRKTMSVNPENSGPIVVHCSAGVGRTGTFITLFSQLQRMKEEKNFDIFGYVRGMRYKRNCMVQTEPQYVFIHDALLEAIECGVTEVQARELREQYKQLCEVDVEQKVTSLNLQFDNLDRTIHRKLRRNTGTLQVNKPKNRYGANPDALPYDRNRCRLSAVPGVEGSDYINASFIDGYHKAKAFIATQGPLPDTQDDFWKLVWQLKSATIVMLTKEKEGGKAKCHRYWPQTGAETYGKLQVISCKSTDFTDYVLREFQLVDTKDSSSLNVKQFQYTDWPEESVPASGSGLIDLIGQVQKWQRNSGDKPIIVHCSGGCGRTGTYIVVSILIERLKTEGVVDVFHTVRNLRLQRPGMVHTESQLEFCYQTTLEYLESFELYDNFK
jgi:protein tyrosine phosphatase